MDPAVMIIGGIAVGFYVACKALILFCGWMEARCKAEVKANYEESNAINEESKAINKETRQLILEFRIANKDVH